MGEETRKRVGKLYSEGKWDKKDLVAKGWAEEFAPKKVEKKVDEKAKK